MSSRVFLDMLEDDPEDGYPSPEHLQLIQFEGCTSGVIALESYEELFNKAARLERERDEARQFAKDQLDSFLKSSGELQSHLKLQQHRVAASLILIERGDAERDSLRADYNEARIERDEAVREVIDLVREAKAYIDTMGDYTRTSESLRNVLAKHKEA